MPIRDDDPTRLAQQRKLFGPHYWTAKTVNHHFVIQMVVSGAGLLRGASAQPASHHLDYEMVVRPVWGSWTAGAVGHPGLVIIPDRHCGSGGVSWTRGGRSRRRASPSGQEEARGGAGTVSADGNIEHCGVLVETASWPCAVLRPDQSWQGVSEKLDWGANCHCGG